MRDDTPQSGGGSGETRLEAVDLGRRVASRWLFRGVGLRLGPGQRAALRGKTGTGKTQLLRALAWLDTPEEGEVRWQGGAVSRLSLPEYRTRVLYLPQRPVLFPGTVEDNLNYPFRFRSHGGKAPAREYWIAALAAVRRRPEFLEQPAGRLSGGEAQLVAVIRATALQPHVLLLDEPTAALDPETAAEVESLLTGWVSGHRAYLWVTHDPAQGERVADHHYLLTENGMEGGR